LSGNSRCDIIRIAHDIPSPGVISTLVAALAINHALGGIPENTPTPLAGMDKTLAIGAPALGAVATAVTAASFGSCGCQPTRTRLDVRFTILYPVG